MTANLTASDDVVDLIEDLEDDQQQTILGALEDVDRVAVQQALSYPEYSAGRLMQREVVMAPDHWTVGQAIDFLRKIFWRTSSRSSRSPSPKAMWPMRSTNTT